MILRRLTGNLRAQNWTAIAIEFAIVVIGVFVGTQVSNWNQGRLEKAQTSRMLEQIRPELADQLAFFESARTYYTTTRGFAAQALAGWSGDHGVSDEQFVIAAYQASQVYGIGINAQTWALTFGGDQLRSIGDTRLRRNLAVVLTADYEPVSFKSMATPYRENVRQVIPDSIQDRIRDECGDRNVSREGSQYIVVIPKICRLKIGPAQAAATAAALRSHRELIGQLNWHLAAIANYMANVDGLESAMHALDRSLDR
jgi:hypothetical protein